MDKRQAHFTPDQKSFIGNKYSNEVRGRCTFLLSIRSEDIFYLKALLQLLNEYIN